ncbi:hypothetical protein ABPG75_012584 [Micractinium tetrahymenae]
MRPANIANYWHAFAWFREWDPDKRVLVEALVHASDPQLAPATARVNQSALAAKFARRPSYKQLGGLEFVSEFDVSRVGASGHVELHGGKHYCAGLWWHVSCELGAGKGGADDIGLRLRSSLPPGASYPDQGLVGDAAAVGFVLDFALAVRHHSAARETWDSAHPAPGVVLRPLRTPSGVQPAGTGLGWPSFKFKGSIDSAPITRANFKAAGSPVVKDGKLAVKATITLKG